MSFDPEIRIAGERVSVQTPSGVLMETSVSGLLAELWRGAERSPSCPVLPERVRVWRERSPDCVGLALELPPQTRRVRWLAADSEAPFGNDARYDEVYLAFPWVVMLLAFKRGALTNGTQLYYRTEPLAQGEELFYPNMLNTAKGHGLSSWLCLIKLRNLRKLSWPEKVEVVVEHVFSAGFNKSAETHEGHSFAGNMATLDDRFASVESWQRASRENPLFPLEVAWRPAKTTVSAQLDAMLERVCALPQLDNAAQLAAMLARAARADKTEKSA